MINRTDDHGRSIYLQDTPSSSPTVIFTGAPGMGKSYVLGRAAEAARNNGDVVLKVDAGSREPLENRLARAVADQYNQLGRSGGGRVLRDLGRIVDRMLGDRRGLAEKAFAKLAPLLERLASRQHPKQPSISELTDRLGELAQQQNKRVLVVIDNLDSAGQRDLATVGELTRQLRANGRPVNLALGASGPAVDALLTADSPDGPAQVRDQYDIRECAPVPEDELRPALVAGLHRRGAAIHPDGVTRLVREANGDPGHLVALVGHAASLAQPPHALDRATAEETIRTQRSADRWAHRATWSGLSDDARVILAATAAHPTGISRDQLPKSADAEAWAEQGRSVGRLVDAGILRRNGDHFAIGDPGFRDWVTTNAGQLPTTGRATKSLAKDSKATQTSGSATPEKQPTGTTQRKVRAARAGTRLDRTALRPGSRAPQRTRTAHRTTGVGRG